MKHNLVVSKKANTHWDFYIVDKEIKTHNKYGTLSELECPALLEHIRESEQVYNKSNLKMGIKVGAYKDKDGFQFIINCYLNPDQTQNCRVCISSVFNDEDLKLMVKRSYEFYVNGMKDIAKSDPITPEMIEQQEKIGKA